MSMNKRIVAALSTGFVVGVLWLVAVRFITFSDKRIHYHANFAVFINGQRDEFKSPTFYEETQSCSAEEVGPKQRVHMHDQKNHVVHVHDEGSTWGHFFANLGYSLSNKSIQTDAGIFTDDVDGNKLTFWLNGQEVRSLANEIIQSKDTVLINYGKDDHATLQNRYSSIERDAEIYNRSNDPSTCSGSRPITFTERLRKSIGIAE